MDTEISTKKRRLHDKAIRPMPLSTKNGVTLAVKRRTTSTFMLLRRSECCRRPNDIARPSVPPRLCGRIGRLVIAGWQHSFTFILPKFLQVARGNSHERHLESWPAASRITIHALEHSLITEHPNVLSFRVMRQEMPCHMAFVVLRWSRGCDPRQPSAKIVEGCSISVEGYALARQRKTDRCSTSVPWIRHNWFFSFGLGHGTGTTTGYLTKHWANPCHSLYKHEPTSLNQTLHSVLSWCLNDAS